MGKKILLLATIILISCAEARAAIDINIITYIESHNNPLAFNPRTQAIGLCQIVPICLADYNQFHKVKYTKKDLFNPSVNKKIAGWYLNKRIPKLIKRKGKKITKRNCLIAYNAGHVYLTRKTLPKETRNYIKKYQQKERGAR